MARLQPRPRTALDDAERDLYDAILAGPRRAAALVDGDGALRGPFGPMLLSPEVGSRLQALGAAVRFATELPAAHRELAILAVAAHWRCRFEWEAHLPLAQEAGLAAEDLAPLWDGGDPVLADTGHELVLRCCREALTTGATSDETYDRGRAALGERGLFELWALLGYYTALALVMNGFTIE